MLPLGNLDVGAHRELGRAARRRGVTVSVRQIAEPT